MWYGRVSSLAVLMLLSGCGMLVGGGNPGSLGTNGATREQLETRSTQGLLAGFDRLHKAIFARIDTNGDGGIDEYEAAPAISLDDFEKADLNLTGKIEYRELVMFATANGWKGWIPGYGKSDTAEKFAGRFRRYLAERFDRLDMNEDGFLKDRELSDRDLQRNDLGVRYPELRFKLRITEVTDEEFKAADKTGDGKLSPGEFEDLFIDLLVTRLKPAKDTDPNKQAKPPAQKAPQLEPKPPDGHSSPVGASNHG